MAAELSIVIPTLNAARTLPVCLAALVEGAIAGLVREVIVTDGGSQDATAEIARDAGAGIVTGLPSRGGQLRRGAQAARGRWLLFLHADTVLEEGWSRAVLAHVQAQVSPAYFRLAFDARGAMPRLVAGWANLRAAVFALPYGDQGLLVSRESYDEAGGFPDQPLMEDVEIARRLGRPLMVLPVRAGTGAERYQRDGWLRRGGRNLLTLTRYMAGADPEALARSYRK